MLAKPISSLRRIWSHHPMSDCVFAPWKRNDQRSTSPRNRTRLWHSHGQLAKKFPTRLRLRSQKPPHLKGSWLKLAGAAGFEPAHGGTKNRCLTAWLRPTVETQLARCGAGFNRCDAPKCRSARLCPPPRNLQPQLAGGEGVACGHS